MEACEELLKTELVSEDRLKMYQSASQRKGWELSFPHPQHVKKKKKKQYKGKNSLNIRTVFLTARRAK